jgi:hypothetical protein
MRRELCVSCSANVERRHAEREGMCSMRFKVAAAAAMVGMLVVGASASLLLFRARPAGRLLTDAELAACLGGSCNNSDMQTQACQDVNNDCLATSIQCTPIPGKTLCARWEPNPQGACVAKQGYDCTCTSKSEGCARIYTGQKVSGGCPKGCNDAKGTCGLVKTECTFRLCDPGD